MRKNGTKYPKIDVLPANAKPVSVFAFDTDTQVPLVYIRFDRYVNGESTKDPKYTIRCFQGTNYVIPA